MAFYRTPALSKSKFLQAYIVGLAIGDGNLTNPNGRATRLRITCDTKYPALIHSIKTSLQKLLPENKVSMIRHGKNAVDVYAYSNHFETLLGWKARSGSKHKQGVTVPSWIKEHDGYKIKCLQGLIETDGCIYNDRGYQMVIFSTIIPELAQNVEEMITSLGFRPHLYCVPKKIGSPFKYQVRLSRNVQSFLKLVRVNKA